MPSQNVACRPARALQLDPSGTTFTVSLDLDCMLGDKLNIVHHVGINMVLTGATSV